MQVIDGAAGGGQILRSSLTLSVVTGQPVMVTNIRAGRSRPGLLRQHLTSVRAAAEICDAAVSGDELGSTEVQFVPGSVRPDTYVFDIGSAGACALVLQTVLLPLLRADAPSRVKIDGGTHNPAAPPYEFLALTFLPALARMGARVDLELVRHGFYPAGGGRLVADVRPGALTPLSVVEPGEPGPVEVRAIVSGLAPNIARREAVTCCRDLGLPLGAGKVVEVPDPRGPGNVVQARVSRGGVTTVLSSFGERGRRAEIVASDLVAAVRGFLDVAAPVDEHLADQLLMPLALAGGGELLTVAPTPHMVTNAEVIRALLGVPVRFVEDGPRCRALVGDAARG
ncbi:MAG TPA: RNA 3'-terminal phosphate cyclase [Myxococcota bacterium]|nr:RNA 3'-terminal phosphate cyclase [Myxococcota bacterium]